MFKQKRITILLVILLLVGLLLTAGRFLKQTVSTGLTCPNGQVVADLIAPIKEGENNSEVLSRFCVEPHEETEKQILEPIDPDTFTNRTSIKVELEPNETLMGPSISTEYRCVSILEPIAEGETESKLIAEHCSSQTINEVGGVDLSSAYLIAKFYDRTNFRSLLREYYALNPCSIGISYGRNDLADDNLDNRFESGQSFSSCNTIEVFDFVDHTGATYACGPNCSSFYALNNNVTSWRVKN